jgi:hypothetical protein
MRLHVAGALFLAVAGCGQSTQPGENQLGANEKAAASSASEAEKENAAGAADNGPGTPQTSEEKSASAISSASGTLPPANAALRFVGRWAHDPSECASKPWRFTASELIVAGGPRCSIYHVSEMAGGYDLAVECPAKKPEPTDLVKLRFAESARAMLVESNAISPTGLVYCGK